MGGLIIKLRPHEQIMINGVIIENGDRQSRLRVVTENARIMRMRDTIDPAKATTPLEHAHYLAQRVISGDLAAAEASAQIRQAIANSASFLGQDTASEIQLFIDRCVVDNDFYRAMQYLRTKTAHADKP
ncbi:MAG: flagellar biosynthesis repressor FlbT [Alphaproteobacteria bacterium]|nr:flagellar biosynthesis repressor FlbT [Alphaproteobacteria bacterium]